LKVFLESIGCRLNQAEIEQFAAKFRKLGYEIVEDADQADLAVINTCSVTAAAASDSRGKIRLAGRSGRARVLVTGCWSEMAQAEALALPGVIQIVRNQEKDRLPELSVEQDPPVIDIRTLKREQLPGSHYRTRAFIKVQDGCNNHCTYCLTRLARGRARSVPFDRLMADISAARTSGGNEIVLTGVNLGSWGYEFDPAESLTMLIERILRETDLPRIRLSSLETFNLGDDFVRLWENPRLCPHLHLPLQSGSERILKRMARRTLLPELADLMGKLRKINPDFQFTTDVIVGFPGETQADFEQTLEFVRTAGFNSGHVFTFSERPGTAAVKLDGKIEKSVKKERSKVLRDQFEAQRMDFCRGMVGKTVQVLWESAEKLPNAAWKMSGLSENYLSVETIAAKNLQNQISRVKLTELKAKKLHGVLD